MPTATSKRTMPSAAVVACYNAVPNVLWSGLAFGPLVLCCYWYVGWPWQVGFGAVSLLAYAWPTAWLRRLQLSHQVTVYQRLRVPALNRFTQQGAWVTALVRRRYPHYRALPSRAGIAKLLRTTYSQERFHWAALIYFLLVSGYVGATGHLGWALGLLLANVGYNLYPIWLQQYLRLRLGHGGAG